MLNIIILEKIVLYIPKDKTNIIEQIIFKNKSASEEFYKILFLRIIPKYKNYRYQSYKYLYNKVSSGSMCIDCGTHLWDNNNICQQCYQEYYSLGTDCAIN